MIRYPLFRFVLDLEAGRITEPGRHIFAADHVVTVVTFGVHSHRGRGGPGAPCRPLKKVYPLPAVGSLSTVTRADHTLVVATCRACRARSRASTPGRVSRLSGLHVNGGQRDPGQHAIAALAGAADADRARRERLGPRQGCLGRGGRGRSARPCRSARSCRAGRSRRLRPARSAPGRGTHGGQRQRRLAPQPRTQHGQTRIITGRGCELELAQLEKFQPVVRVSAFAQQCTAVTQCDHQLVGVLSDAGPFDAALQVVPGVFVEARVGAAPASEGEQPGQGRHPCGPSPRPWRPRC